MPQLLILVVMLLYTVHCSRQQHDIKNFNALARESADLEEIEHIMTMLLQPQGSYTSDKETNNNSDDEQDSDDSLAPKTYLITGATRYEQ